MKSSDTAFAIGEMAQRFGLATHVLRHWESMGLLTPARIAGQRRYTTDDAYRVATILRGKQAGLSLEQIQQMITTSDPASRAGILRARREELLHRLAATQKQLEIIGCVLRCRHADFTQCPRFREMITDQSGLHAPTAPARMTTDRMPERSGDGQQAGDLAPLA